MTLTTSPEPTPSPDLPALRRLLCGEGQPGVWLKPGLRVDELVQINRILSLSEKETTHCAAYWSYLDGAEERYQAGLGTGRARGRDPAAPAPRSEPQTAPATPGGWGDLETIKANRSRKRTK